MKPIFFPSRLRRGLPTIIWLLLCLAGHSHASNGIDAMNVPVTPLCTALNSDGTIRAGTRGSFNAKGYSLRWAPDGRPAFSPENIKHDLANDIDRCMNTLLDGGTNGPVSALAISSSGTLYVGGFFTRAGGVSAKNIAKWDGSSWAPLGAGLGNIPSDVVTALAISNSGTLYAGGRFGTAGGVTANNIAQWNGAGWTPLGAGITGNNNGISTEAVRALAVSSTGMLYAAGNFDTAGGVSANNIAQWNGSSWAPLGAGLGNSGNLVNALTISSTGTLYAAGFFVPYVAQWNGSSWSRVGPVNGTRPGNQILALAISSTGILYAHGDFDQANGTYSTQRLGQWDGTSWTTVAGTAAPNGSAVAALAINGGGALYAGGGFFTAGGISANNIALWNGVGWAQLGIGTSDGVSSLAISNAGTVYVGGAFRTAGGTTVNHIAQWNGSNWMSLEDQPILLTAYHLPQPGLSTLRRDLQVQVTGILKVGADNAAGTLVNVGRRGSQILSFRIRENPTNASSGPLADKAGYFGLASLTSTSVEAVYHHPAFVDSLGPHRTLHLEIVDITAPLTPVSLGTYRVRAMRPPLMLVHGLWSNGAEAFPGLRAKLVADGFYSNANRIIYADYASDRAFADNAVKFRNHKNALLQYYADQNISASKVDIIGHSMGGLIARQYIQDVNYQQDVNKLITLNTPHSGSPISNFINTLPASLIAFMVKAKHDPTQGAVADLSYNGSGITQLNSSPNTKGVALHTITTTITLGPSGQYSWGEMLIGWMALTNRTVAGRGLDAFLTSAVFRSNYDLIVGLNSQQGGLTNAFTNNITRQWHGSGGNPSVQNSIEDLLRANSNSTITTNPFTTAGFQPPVLTSIFRRDSFSKQAAKVTSTLQINSPTRSTFLTDPDSIQVAVSGSSDITNILLVCANGTPEITTKLISGANGAAYIKVPRNGLGRLQIGAFAFADSLYVQYDTLSTRLTTNATLTGVRVERDFIYTSLGDSTIVSVTGTFSDGTDRDILNQPGLAFTFPAGKAYTRGNGWIIGVSIGLDSMQVTYAGRRVAKALHVVVNQPLAVLPQSKLVQKLEIWPNPAQHFVKVSGGGAGSIEIFDLMGRVLQTQVYSKSSQVATFNLQGLPSGVYLVRVGAITRRLLIEQ